MLVAIVLLQRGVLEQHIHVCEDCPQEDFLKPITMFPSTIETLGRDLEIISKNYPHNFSFVVINDKDMELEIHKQTNIPIYEKYNTKGLYL